MTHVLHIARINNVDSAMFCKHDSEIQFLKWTGLKWTSAMFCKHDSEIQFLKWTGLKWTSKHLSLSTKVVIETRLEDENSLNDIGY